MDRSRILENMAFFDLEAVPDESREDQFPAIEGTEPKPEQPVPDTWTVEDMLNPKINNADSVVARLRQHNPPEEFLAALESAEKDREKPRKTILDGIDGIRKAKAAWKDEVGKKTKARSTCAETCRIVALSIGLADTDPTCHVVKEYPGPLDYTEPQLLRWFWNQVAGYRMAGYYILGYDLPVILARSVLLGVRPTRTVNLSPWQDDTIDLYFKRYGRNNPPKDHPSKLKQLCRAYGIEVPAGDFDGSMVYETWKSGDVETLRHYCDSDVVCVRELYLRWYGYWV